MSVKGSLQLAGFLAIVGGAVMAQTADVVDRTELKVCADPNNLPFSDERLEGF